MRHYNIPKERQEEEYKKILEKREQTKKKEQKMKRKVQREQIGRAHV